MTGELNSIVEARGSWNQQLLADDYTDIHGNAEQLSTMLDYLAPVAGGHYLDLATGSGYLAFALAAGNPDCRVIGVDIVDKAIAANRERAKSEGLTNLDFQVVGGIRLPFDDSTFDGVASRYAFHHFPEPALTLADVHRVLKPGRQLVLADAVRRDDDAEDFINAFQKLQPDGHIEMYTTDALVKHLTDAGFEERIRSTASITFPRELDERYHDLFANTEPEILNAYILEAADTLATARFDVVSVALNKPG